MTGYGRLGRVSRPTQSDRSAASPGARTGGSPTTTQSRPFAPSRPSGPRRDDEHRSARRAERRRPDGPQPLAASWDPEPGPAPRPGRRGWVATYGWRAYALPVLVVLTALALLDTARTPDPETSAQARTTAPETAPLIPNPGAGPGFAAAKAAAELPGGGPFTERGAGTWTVVPGAGPQFGTGRLFTYTVEVEDGVELPGGPEGFAATVDGTLQNPKSWIGSGEYSFRRIEDPRAADIRVTLTSQLTQRAICGFAIPYDASCWEGELRQVVLSTARWARGAVAFQGNVVQYQQYVINHEVGHALGFVHTPCEATGRLAPIMMQQTWGVSNDYLTALGTDGVTADGKVCEPNAWPFPTVE